MSQETTVSAEPRVLPRAEHTLSRRSISANALKVLYRLHRAGYQAYLVGGGVRDLLLGRQPKDFDIATNARPQEIRRLFRNSRVIGRRFRLVHVLFTGEVVEVSTFRSGGEPPEVPDAWEEDEREPDAERLSDEPEEVVEGERGEAFGTAAEDAWRRDLTVNALFYNVADFTVIDHVGGLDDLAAGVVRAIGPPRTRFREDPVRMMRALEYAVRLGFRLDDDAAAAIRECAALIAEAAPARLAYELLETLRSGHSAGIVGAWKEFGILEHAFPEVADAGTEAEAVLEAVDAIIRSDGGRPLDATLIGALVLPRYCRLVERLGPNGARVDNVALIFELRQMLESFALRMRLSNFNAHLLFNGLFALTKLRRPPERGRQVIKLVRQDCFRVLWELHTVGVHVGLFDPEIHAAWERAIGRARQAGDEVAEDVVVDPVRRTRRRRRPRRRRRS